MTAAAATADPPFSLTLLIAGRPACAQRRLGFDRADEADRQADDERRIGVEGQQFLQRRRGISDHPDRARADLGMRPPDPGSAAGEALGGDDVAHPADRLHARDAGGDHASVGHHRAAGGERLARLLQVGLGGDLEIAEVVEVGAGVDHPLDTARVSGGSARRVDPRAQDLVRAGLDRVHRPDRLDRLRAHGHTSIDRVGRADLDALAAAVALLGEHVRRLAARPGRIACCGQVSRQAPQPVQAELNR